MSDFVLDASAALAFVFPDERDAAAIALARSLRSQKACAPVIWRWEMEDAVVTAERVGRLSTKIATAIIDDIVALPVELLRSQPGYVAHARRFKLSIYDALYLELAHRLALPLLTRDGALRRAAKALGVRASRGPS